MLPACPYIHKTPQEMYCENHQSQKQQKKLAAAASLFLFIFILIAHNLNLINIKVSQLLDYLTHQQAVL